MGGDSFRQEERRQAQISRDVSGQSTYQVLQQQQAPYGGPEAREASSLAPLVQAQYESSVETVKNQLIEQYRQEYAQSVEEAYQQALKSIEAQKQQIFETYGMKPIAKALRQLSEWKQLKLEAFEVAVKSREEYIKWLEQHKQQIFETYGMREIAQLARMADLSQQIESQAKQIVKGEVITALSFTALVGSVVAAPVIAISGAAAGATFETVKTGIMEGKLPTAEQLITAAGFSAAGAVAMSAAAPVISEAASAITSKLPEAVGSVIEKAGETLTSTSVSGVLSREALGTGVGAAAGAIEAAVKGEDVLKGAAAGAVAGAAAAAVGEAVFRTSSFIEQEVLGVKAYEVKGAESYEVTRETEEAIGGTRITKVEAEPTRITKEQAELLRYTQIEEIKMAGTAEVIYKGGGDILKQTGIGWEASYQGSAAEDILQAASRGGGIVTETVYMEKAPGVGQLRLAEYETATAKLTGVQAFGKIDPQVYLSFIKNVPPEVAGEWLTQMGGLPVSQLSQVTSPINIVMHEVFALPPATVPAGAIAGGIAGAAIGEAVQPKIELPKVNIAPSTSIVQPSPEKTPTATPAVTTILPQSIEKTEQILEIKPTISKPVVAPSPIEASPIVKSEPISNIQPIVEPKPTVAPSPVPSPVEETSPVFEVKPSLEILPKEAQVPTPQTVSSKLEWMEKATEIAKPKLTPHVKLDLEETIQPQLPAAPSPITETTISPLTEPRLAPHVKLIDFEETSSIVKSELKPIAKEAEQPQLPITPSPSTVTKPKPWLTPHVRLFDEEETGIMPKLKPELIVVPKQEEKLSPTEPIVTPIPKEILKPSLEILPKETPALQISQLPKVQPLPRFSERLSTLPRIEKAVFEAPKVSTIAFETSTTVQKSKQETVSTVPTPAPPLPPAIQRTTPLSPLPPWHKSEGIRAPDFGRLVFGGKYVKRHQIALPSQVTRHVLGRGKMNIGFSSSSLIFGKQVRRGAGLLFGSPFSSFIFDVGRQRRGFGKSLVEVIFG